MVPLSQEPHPKALGSRSHPSSHHHGFSEAQLELITGIHPNPEDVLQELADIHVFVQKNIGDELIWPNSMPCILAADQEKFRWASTVAPILLRPKLSIAAGWVIIMDA